MSAQYPFRTQMRALGAAAAVALLAGCATAAPQSSSSRLYFGLVRVVAPAVKGDTTATEVTALGLGLENGVWAGWRRSSWVSADPAKCQLLVIIRSNADATHAAQVLRSLEGVNPCIVDQSRTLPR